MVVLSEINSMFWGVTLDGGKHYTQTVERSFHISMAALEPRTNPAAVKENKQPVSVMIQHDKAEFMLCTLEYGRVYQQALDLNFTEGEEVTFFLNGNGIVHLTGYLIEDENMMSDMEDPDFSMEGLSAGDSDSESDTAPALVTPEISGDSDEDSKSPAGKAKKRKKEIKEKPGKKKAKVVVIQENDDEDDDDDDEAQYEDSDDDDEDDGDIEADIVKQIMTKKNKQPVTNTPLSGKKSAVNTPKSAQKQAVIVRAESDDSDEDDDDDYDEDEDEEEIVRIPTATKNKTSSAANTPKSEGKTTANTPKSEMKAQTPKQEVKNGGDATESAKKKKKKKKKNEDSKEKPGPGGDAQKGKAPDTPKKSVLAGGTISEEIKVGHGPEAKDGKMVHVYYSGKLSKSGKQFDSCTSGKPFKFRLGKREVISGWDMGVSGMKVGGKRRLTVPPQQGYGNQRTGPIPPNSTLIFEVELKAVS